MTGTLDDIVSLRAEARLLGVAGGLLLMPGLTVTVIASLLSVASGGEQPLLPLLVGGPLLGMGYLACHLASVRAAKASALASQNALLAALSQNC